MLPAEDEFANNPNLAGPRFSLELGLGASWIGIEVTHRDYRYREDEYEYEVVEDTVGGFPSFDAGLVFRQFVSRTSGMNIDLMERIQALFVFPLHKDNGEWAVGGLGELDIIVSPSSLPLYAGAGVVLGGLGSKFPDGDAKGDAFVAVNLAEVGLLVGEERKLAIGARFFFGYLFMSEDRVMDLRLFCQIPLG